MTFMKMFLADSNIVYIFFIGSRIYIYECIFLLHNYKEQNTLYTYQTLAIIMMPIKLFLLSELGAPQGTRIVKYECNKIQITWLEPDIRLRNGPITGYTFKNNFGVSFSHQLYIFKRKRNVVKLLIIMQHISKYISVYYYIYTYENS